VLIAEDDPIYLRLLDCIVSDEFEVVLAKNGIEAWEALESPDAPRVVLLDWLMPGMDGLEVCRRIRSHAEMDGVFVVIATARQQVQDILAGFDAGANDYIIKPFHPEELRARLRVGHRVVELQSALASRVSELENALSRVKLLQGLLPICSYCKRIRNDSDYWQQVETYMSEHSEAVFTHGICPECYDKFMKTELMQLRKEKDPGPTE
jgi:DNA-binding response OmpR family regulator